MERKERKERKRAELFPEHRDDVRRCTCCYLVYASTECRCPNCRNPEFSLVRKDRET